MAQNVCYLIIDHLNAITSILRYGEEKIQL